MVENLPPPFVNGLAISQYPGFYQQPCRETKDRSEHAGKTCYRGREYVLLLPTSKHAMTRVQVKSVFASNILSLMYA